MTPRSIRRAAERKAKKQARKAANHLAPDPITLPIITDPGPGRVEACLDPLTPELPESFSISPAQLAANRANAQNSTGPNTAQGKAVTCLNAVKTALTGRTVLLPSDDAAEYERHIHAYEKELRPMGQRECDLAQSIADTAWRLKRIPGLVMAIFARGHVEFAGSFQQHDPSLRPGMIELETFIVYEKQLRNLQLQEARLSRRREKETAELRQLQQERSQREARDLKNLSSLYLLAKHDKRHFDPAHYGFEFSTHDVELYMEGARATKFANELRNQEHDRAKTHSQAA